MIPIHLEQEFRQTKTLSPELKTFLASETWARYTWEQRVKMMWTKIHVSFLAKPTSKQVTYHYPKFGVKCVTLSQMTF